MPLPIRLTCAKCGEESLHAYAAGIWVSVCCNERHGIQKPSTALSTISTRKTRSKGGCNARLRQYVFTGK